MNPASLISELRRLWVERPAEVAVVHEGREITFAAMQTRSESLAKHYRRLGVGPGDRVLTQLPNRPEALTAIAATWLCGAIHVGIDATATRAEVTGAVERLTPRVVVGADLGRPELLDGLPVHAVEVGAPRVCAESATTDPVAVIFLSSGTTGAAKFAVGFHRNLATRWTGLAQWLTFGAGDVHLAQLPLSHGFGLMMSMAALLSGGRLVLLDHFSPVTALRAVERERVTVLNGTPSHYRLLLREMTVGTYDLRGLRVGVGSGAAISPALAAGILDRFGIRFVSMYGSSEGVGVATSNRHDIMLGSVGRPRPGSVRIVNHDRRTLPNGEVGEIAFGRAEYPVQYWQPGGAGPGAIAATRARWYYSGDLGHLDAEGRLYVHGRVDRQINCGGVLVDPCEVEDVLLSCPQVSDAVVFARPDEIHGQRVCAAVVLTEVGCTDQVLDRTRTLLSPAKTPRELYELPAIPCTARGKTDMQRMTSLIGQFTS